MKKKLKQKINEYTAFFEPAEEGGFVVSVPVLPGCVTEGDTFEEARENIIDAIKGYIAVLKEEGEKVPEEKENTIITKISVANHSQASI